MGIGYGHELTFENEVDQTYLRGFAKTLFADYGKYTEWLKWYGRQKHE